MSEKAVLADAMRLEEYYKSSISGVRIIKSVDLNLKAFSRLEYIH